MTEQTLAGRVDRLERQNRTLRRTVAAAALVAGAFVWMAQVPIAPPEVRARRITIVNDNDQAVIELLADGNVPTIAVRDGDDVLVELAGRLGRGVIRYRDQDGVMRDLTAPPGPRPAARR
ncbi:MAG TPA: hypothetical protein VNK41_11695 [Vicinamibacterales bacterium]|nr:hypothetical protein [Vicinamibacterales bacterium]